VPHNGVCTNVGCKLGDVEFAPIVDWPSPQEHFAALEEAQTPTRRRLIHPHRKRHGLSQQYTAAEIGSIANQSE
jgi:hypothetical protein